MVLLAFALPAAVAALTLTQAHQIATGPLIGRPPAADAVTGWSGLPVGASRCYRPGSVVNDGTGPATIQSVVLHETDGLGVGTALVLTPAQAAGHGPLRPDGCPAQGQVASGFVVPPDASQPTTDQKRESVVAVGLTVTTGGEHHVTGVTVHYRVDGRSHQVKLPADVWLCTTDCSARIAVP